MGRQHSDREWNVCALRQQSAAHTKLLFNEREQRGPRAKGSAPTSQNCPGNSQESQPFRVWPRGGTREAAREAGPRTQAGGRARAAAGGPKPMGSPF